MVASLVAVFVVSVGSVGCGQPNLTSGGVYECPSLLPELLRRSTSAHPRARARVTCGGSSPSPHLHLFDQSLVETFGGDTTRGFQ
jgi:hypothetical protein